MQFRRRIAYSAVTVLSLVLPVAIAVAWGASAVWFPHVRGPLPGGRGEAHDHVLVCLLDGRLIALRRIATLVTNSPAMRITPEKVPVPSNPNDWPQPLPRVRVDLRDAREVMVEDYSVRPPRFAPESYRHMSSEREVIGSYPWGWLGVDLGEAGPPGHSPSAAAPSPSPSRCGRSRFGRCCSPR